VGCSTAFYYKKNDEKNKFAEQKAGQLFKPAGCFERRIF
jgi:hypothetical protein